MKHSPYVGQTDSKSKIRLLLITPMEPFEANQGVSRLEKPEFISESTLVDEVFCSGAPPSIENSTDKRNAIPFVLEKVRWAESQGYDLIIINCMLDPGLEESRRAVSIPVIGLREATTAVARMLGKNPGYIFPQNVTVRNLADDENLTYSELLKSGRSKVVNQGADVLIPNCALLGGLAGRLQTELSVPVLPNRDLAIKLGELIAMFQLAPEASSVAETRSRSKILLSKMYQLPVIGELIYRTGHLVKSVIRASKPTS